MTTITAKSKSQPVPARSAVRDERRASRFAARRVLWSESRLTRLTHCGNSLSKHSGDGRNVAVKLSEGTAGFAGLQTCGSPWACPVCSQKIAAVRAEEVQTAVNRWHARGGRVVFLTLTMRHRKGQPLAQLWDALSYAWGRVTSGRDWVADCEYHGELLPRVIKSGKRKGETVNEYRLPYIRAVEATFGDNGWHLHIHALLFLGNGKHAKATKRDLAGSAVNDKDVALLADSVFSRWKVALTAKGLAAPTRRRGVDTKLIRRGDSKALGDYFTKSVYVGRVGDEGAGWEITGGQGKTARGVNRTPFQVLADIVAVGDAADLGTWHEWEKASKGRRQLTWSVGLRDLLCMKPEKTDEDIAAEDAKGDVVMRFDYHEWRIIRWRAESVLALVEMGCDKPQVLQLLGVDFTRADR